MSERERTITILDLHKKSASIRDNALDAPFPAGFIVEASLNDLKPIKKEPKKLSEEEILARILHPGNLLPKSRKQMMESDDYTPPPRPPGKRCHCTKTRIFRYGNLIRSIFTTTYGLVTIGLGWNSPTSVLFKAMPYQVAVVIFLILDIVPTAFKCFPELFCLPRHLLTRDFSDPKRVSIWHLVADYDLLLDMLPVIANVVLKIYGYRYGELTSIVTDNQSIDLSALSGSVSGGAAALDSQFQNAMASRSFNLSLLILFIVTLGTTILFHVSRLMQTLFYLKAKTLAMLVLVKIALMVFDLFVNAFFLYTVLQSRGFDLFKMDLLASFTLSVVTVSVLVTSLTSIFVNFPIHIAYMYMLLRLHAPGQTLPFKTIAISALRKTFHPFIMAVFGTYALWSIIAMAYTMISLQSFNLANSGSYVTGGPQFSGGSQGALFGFLWLDLVINYGSAVLLAVLFWIWFFIYYFGGVALCILIARKLCCKKHALADAQDTQKISKEGEGTQITQESAKASLQSVDQTSFPDVEKMESREHTKTDKGKLRRRASEAEDSASQHARVAPVASPSTAMRSATEFAASPSLAARSTVELLASPSLATKTLLDDDPWQHGKPKSVWDLALEEDDGDSSAAAAAAADAAAAIPGPPSHILIPIPSSVPASSPPLTNAEHDKQEHGKQNKNQEDVKTGLDSNHDKEPVIAINHHTDEIEIASQVDVKSASHYDTAEATKEDTKEEEKKDKEEKEQEQEKEKEIEESEKERNQEKVKEIENESSQEEAQKEKEKEKEKDGDNDDRVVQSEKTEE